MANDILQGRISDPTGGATFFMASAKYIRGDANTLKGFYHRAVKSRMLVDSPYLSRSNQLTKNHFFVEVKKPKKRDTSKRGPGDN